MITLGSTVQQAVSDPAASGALFGMAGLMSEGDPVPRSQGTAVVRIGQMIGVLVTGDQGQFERYVHEADLEDA